jgi:hypothetical protein
MRKPALKLWVGIALILGFALLLGRAASQEPPPAPRRPSLAAEETDFRGCDRDWNRVNDLWTVNLADPHTPSEAADSEDSQD